MTTPRRPFTKKLVEQLCIPHIKEALKRNKESRLFNDLPDELDCLFVNAGRDQAELVFILKHISVYDTMMTDKGRRFNHPSILYDLKCWAKNIIRHASNELLTDELKVKPQILAVLGEKNQNISPHDIICAYFSTVSQYIIVALSENRRDFRMIDPRVLEAFTLYLNEYGLWVDEVLSNGEFYRQLYSLGAGLFAAVSSTAAVAVALMTSNDNNSDNDSESPELQRK